MPPALQPTPLNSSVAGSKHATSLKHVSTGLAVQLCGHISLESVPAGATFHDLRGAISSVYDAMLVSESENPCQHTKRSRSDFCPYAPTPWSKGVLRGWPLETKTLPADGALESTMQSISKVELIAATLVTTRRKRTVTPSAAANEISVAFVELMTGRSASRACSEVDSITLSAYAAVPGKKLSSSGSHATAIALVSLRKHETFSDMPCTIKRPRPGGDT
eukprot:scaffold26716_cov71-Phaeocystis_antarctica.AAC.2